MQHTKQITTLLRMVFASLLLIPVIIMTACSETKKAKTPDMPFEDIPEFVFAYSYSPEDPDASGGIVKYICKNGDVLEFSDNELYDLSLDERMEKHANGGFSDHVVKTVSQEEVVKHYKTLISVIDRTGSNLLDYPEAVPSVEAPTYSWTGFYYDQDELRFADLHKNMCMTDISSKDDAVNGLYEWMKSII